MGELFNRIEQVCSQKEHTLKDFLNKCGIRKSTWDMGKSRGSTPSIDSILGVLRAYPSVSAEWLLRGIGTMEKENGQIVGDIKESTVVGVNVNGKGIKFECPHEKDDISLLKEMLRNYHHDVCVFQSQINELISLVKNE